MLSPNALNIVTGTVAISALSALPLCTLTPFFSLSSDERQSLASYYSGYIGYLVKERLEEVMRNTRVVKLKGLAGPRGS